MRTDPRAEPQALSAVLLAATRHREAWAGSAKTLDGGACRVPCTSSVGTRRGRAGQGRPAFALAPRRCSDHCGFRAGLQQPAGCSKWLDGRGWLSEVAGHGSAAPRGTLDSESFSNPSLESPTVNSRSLGRPETHLMLVGGHGMSHSCHDQQDLAAADTFRRRRCALGSVDSGFAQSRDLRRHGGRPIAWPPQQAAARQPPQEEKETISKMK